MNELFEERRSNWRVYENHKLPGKQLDLAVVDRHRPANVVLGVELKFEPSHARAGGDIRGDTAKFPVCLADEIARDVDAVSRCVTEGLMDLGYALLLDEGGYWRFRQTPPGGECHIWGSDTKTHTAPALFVTRVTSQSDRQRYVPTGDGSSRHLDMEQPDADELSTPFAVPNATLRGGERLGDGPIQMPRYEYDEAGERLMRFAYHGAYDWMNDPEREQQEALVASLRSGEADDPVSGETELLWRCLFAVVRSERFTEGMVAANALALTRIANELRRRLLTKI